MNARTSVFLQFRIKRRKKIWERKRKQKKLLNSPVVGCLVRFILGFQFILYRRIYIFIYSMITVVSTQYQYR